MSDCRCRLVPHDPTLLFETRELQNAEVDGPDGNITYLMTVPDGPPIELLRESVERCNRLWDDGLKALTPAQRGRR